MSSIDRSISPHDWSGWGSGKSLGLSMLDRKSHWLHHHHSQSVSHRPHMRTVLNNQTKWSPTHLDNQRRWGQCKHSHPSTQHSLPWAFDRVNVPPTHHQSSILQYRLDPHPLPLPPPWPPWPWLNSDHLHRQHLEAQELQPTKRWIAHWARVLGYIWHNTSQNDYWILILKTQYQ